MRESRTYGSVRGALSNERPYREHHDTALKAGCGSPLPFKRKTMMADAHGEQRIAAQLGELVNWTRRIFWLLLSVLVLEVILVTFLTLRYLAA